MSIPQSAIDSRVALWLGNIPEWAIDPAIEHMHREDEISFRVAQLDLSHQNHRTIKTTINLPVNTREVPMPAGFSNPVTARLSYNIFTGQNAWIPVDIVNLDTIGERQLSAWPSIAFFGPANTAQLSWTPRVAMQLVIYYQPLSLTSKLETAPMPIADLFLGLVTASIARKCLPSTKMPDVLKAQYKITLDETINGRDGRSGWEELWSKLMCRAPAQGSLRRQGFLPSWSYFSPGRVGRGWSGGSY